MNKKINILIPNATAPRNIGDLAMLEVLIDLIKKTYPNPYIVIHSYEPNLHRKDLADEIDETIYYWSVFNKRSFLVRSNRVLQVIIYYFLERLCFSFLWPDKSKLKKLASDYQNADVIVFVGGGYFRSKKGITQTLNLLMQISLVLYAKLYNNSKIIAPISFGPTASKWLEFINAKVISDLDVVSVREKVSFNLLKKYKIKNLILSSDHALLVESIPSPKEKKQVIVGFTIKKWLDTNGQFLLEKAYIESLSKFSQKTGAWIQPIIQVDAPLFGDYDFSISKHISKKIKKNGVTVLPPKKISDVKDALETYSNITLLLGMRAHSNILSAVVGTPFVAVSYEYKTEGISKDLDMSDYVIKCTAVNSQNLYKLLIKAYKNSTQLNKTIDESLTRIRQKETERWNTIFQSYAPFS
jgi:colanic acid/amylovoran biosynthesis protein WcaK/AmsJ